MNGHELWRLRELGLGGIQVQRQESNFWSKYNSPVLQWSSENPRHGFGAGGGCSSSDDHDWWSDAAAGATSERKPSRVRFDLAGGGGREIACQKRPGSTTDPPHHHSAIKIRRIDSPSSSSSSPSREESTTSSSSSSASTTPKYNAKCYITSSSTTQSSSSSSPISILRIGVPPPTAARKKDGGNYYFISSKDSLRETCAAAFPQFAQERHVDLGQSNKIFAARWLSDDRIVMGTKCNSILVMDAGSRKSAAYRPPSRLYEDEDGAGGAGGSASSSNRAHGQQQRRSWISSTPITKINVLKGSIAPPPADQQNCGIHAIDVNPSGTLLASGGDNPADVSVFRLPNFEPLTVGETAHNDWLFDLQWLDDEYLVSGSRDSTLALWRFPNNQEDMIVCSHSSRLLKSHHGPLSGGRVGDTVCAYQQQQQYPSSRPIEVRKLQRFDKVRALKFNNRHKVLTSVSLNSYLHVLDICTFRQKSLRRMDGYQECVCLCNSPDEDLLTVGSRTSFAFYDTRTWERVGDEKLPRRADEDPHSLQSMMPSGVRSASWRGHMLTLGTGGGEIMFYDVRAKKFLQCDCNRSLTLKISGGWLQQDEVYQELFLNLPCPNAVYAHCYDEYGSRLFAAGGPIAASLVGNYAAMWG